MPSIKIGMFSYIISLVDQVESFTKNTTSGMIPSLVRLLMVLGISCQVLAQELPSTYEYFTEGGVKSGLIAANKEFRLNGKEIRILSGAMHYFRIHPDLWRDRLRKLRAMGANTVETYVSWNLHEPKKDEFDFGTGRNDFSAFMNLQKFVRIAQEEDLLVILRPGPFVCAEWDWGGLPSWLQRDPNMRIRENYQPWLDRVKIFLDQLLIPLKDEQFTRNGSIIALQIENEYSSFSPRDREYLTFIREVYNDNGFADCLYFTADNSGIAEISGGLPDILQTANTHNPNGSFPELFKVQPDMPMMAMEFYAGWFNHWFDEKRESRDKLDYTRNLLDIFTTFSGSVNLYMVHGGTSFGFMNGANGNPYVVEGFDTTSYDYDAPISEAGDYNVHYDTTAEIFDTHAIPKLRKPAKPPQSLKSAYAPLKFTEYLTYNDIIERIPSTHKVNSQGIISMENMPINDDNGQSYGWIIYRLTGPTADKDNLTVSWPRDFAQFIVDGDRVTVDSDSEYWINSVKEFTLDASTNADHTLDIMVENMGRINYGGADTLRQQKGLAPAHEAKMEFNGKEVTQLQVISAEFRNAWAASLTGYKNTADSATLKAPVLLKTTFTIIGSPADTFLDMRGWHKGIVFINGFNIGRYFKVGPQETLYIPAPLLHTGDNTVLVFEQIQPGSGLNFTTEPRLGDPKF